VTLSWPLQLVHLLALGVGLGAIWTRARALSGTVDRAKLRNALAADTAWGIAALLWISTGLWRWLGGVEKGTDYYLQNHLFLAKMLFLVIILALEVAPMMALIRWRIALKKGLEPDVSRAGSFAKTSLVQAVLVVLMVACATGMARGYGVPHE
jgi:putative membrane protein